MKKLTNEEFRALPNDVAFYSKFTKTESSSLGFYIDSPPTPNPDDLKMIVDVASRIYAMGNKNFERSVNDAKGLIQACKEAVK